MGGTEEDREGEVGCGSAPGTGKRSRGEGGEERLPVWKLFDERKEGRGCQQCQQRELRGRNDAYECFFTNEAAVFLARFLNLGARSRMHVFQAYRRLSLGAVRLGLRVTPADVLQAPGVTAIHGILG